MKRILFVDDEPHVSRVAQLSLERAGYEVELASDGLEGLEKLLAEPYDVLITDMMMPRMNGWELCEAIQEQIPERKFFIFVVTSRSEAEHREWAESLPRAEFIEKPLSLSHLISRLRHHLGDPS